MSLVFIWGDGCVCGFLSDVALGVLWFGGRVCWCREEFFDFWL